MKTPRRSFCRHFLVTVMALAALDLQAADGPFQATGMKVGEVTDSSAIVWTRLTLRPTRNSSDGPMVEIVYANAKQGKSRSGRVTDVRYPEGKTVADIRDAVPGDTGQTRVLYRPRGTQPWAATDWASVDAQKDFTRQFPLTDLNASTAYELRVEARNATDMTPGQSLDGGFRTAPRADDVARVMFTVSTGQAYNDQDRPDGFHIYPVMRQLDPDFFVHTGDIVYYDQLAKTAELARYHWQRTYSLPTNVDFHRYVASYFIKDDHDTLMNDCWPSMKTNFMFRFTFEEGQAIFRQQVPMGQQTHRSRRWGQDLTDLDGRGAPISAAPTPIPMDPTKRSGETSRKRGSRTVFEIQTQRFAS